jgi:acetamidase/formamidase
MRECNDKMCASVNDIKMPCIEKFLSNNFATSVTQGDKVCIYCEKYIPKSMSSHHRYCTSKKDVSVLTMPIEITTGPIEITPTNLKKNKKNK